MQFKWDMSRQIDIITFVISNTGKATDGPPSLYLLYDRLYVNLSPLHTRIYKLFKHKQHNIHLHGKST